MDKGNLEDILAAHIEWIMSYTERGARANLSDCFGIFAYARNADLKWADLMETASVGLAAKCCSRSDGMAGRCRAGWAITLAGQEGTKLEEALGPAAAGALIYYESTGRVPNFYASDDTAIEDMEISATAPITSGEQISHNEK